ncbi:hypothetical protein ACFY3M_15020 [Streptomyces mirabilis]|uniref:hypothetical protein n=1 Tax=Streptomyces mirabilis TaxID=68239 RepID=UPI0036C65ED5
MPIDAPRFNCGEMPEGTPRRAAAVVTYISEVHRDHATRLPAPDEPEGIRIRLAGESYPLIREIPHATAPASRRVRPGSHR